MDKPRFVCDLCRWGRSGTFCAKGGIDKCFRRERHTFFEPPQAERGQTNGDRIRGMTDAKLAREMLFFIPAYAPPNIHYTGLAGSYYEKAPDAVQANLEWLQQPAKEDT